jgi:CBS domain-containing protein
MYRSDYGDRTQSPTYYAGYYRQRTLYGTLGRDAESNYETRGRQIGREEDRSRYDRSNIGRGRAYEDYDYDRERRRQRPSREEYGEPRYRETFSGRYGQQRWPSRSGEERGQGVDFYSGEPYYRGEDRRSRRDTYSGQNYLRSRDIMTKDVTTCSPQSSIREAAEKMQDENVGSLPVVDNGRLIGIVTDRDIVCRVLAEGRDSRAATVADAMSEDLVTCTPEETVLDAIRKMGEHQIRRIPVCDINGRLRGIIAMADVALEAERDRELAEALEEISQPLPNRSRRM